VRSSPILTAQQDNSHYHAVDFEVFRHDSNGGTPMRDPLYTIVVVLVIAILVLTVLWMLGVHVGAA
jgi:hypothetical protein